MSHTTIDQKTKWEIWLKAGGRCQYKDCNVPLWRDNLTLRKMNAAHLAHIISDTPDGPRGDPILSDRLKSDPSNIMLLCLTHHRLIDIEEVEEHSVELLTEYKRLHEERIQLLTGINPNRRTHILLMCTRIGEHQVELDYNQAYHAILPERYPADEKPIRIDLTSITINEGDAEFWNVAVKVIDREYGRYLDDMIGPSGTPINHLSVFAVAPIPLLIYLGKRLGDISSVDVYQRHRFTKSWRWENIQDNLFDYAIDYPQIVGKPTKCVAVNLSLSGTIHSGEIIQSVGAGVPIYTIRISNPRRDFLIAKEYLELFANRWHRLLSDIRKIHGPSSEILLFPAVPNSVAVEIGRALRPKIDPSIHIYNKSWSDFEFVMTV